MTDSPVRAGVRGGSPRTLQELQDVQVIRDTLMRYWRGLDRAVPELVRAAYHDDGYDDHGYFKGPADGFVASLDPVFRMDCTMHYTGQVSVGLAGDTALSESYTEAHHITKDADGLASDGLYGLRYVDHWERRAGAWRIAHRTCAWDWYRRDAIGDQSFGPGFFRGPRDRSDPAFRGAGHDRPPTLDELRAKAACYDALMRYVRGVDRCDLALTASAYHPDASDDHGAYKGDVAGFLSWVKGAVMDALDGTMHNIGNILIEVDGDVAFSEAYAETHHLRLAPDGGSDTVIGLRYLDRFENRAGDWRIADRVMSYDWRRTDALAPGEFPAGFQRGRRDGSDPVFRRRAGQP